MDELYECKQGSVSIGTVNRQSKDIEAITEAKISEIKWMSSR